MTLRCKLFSYRASPSYFDQLPQDVNANTGGVLYEKSCSCNKKIDWSRTDECVDGMPVLFPSGFISIDYDRIKKCDSNPLADREGRDTRNIEGSDDLTEDDFKVFQDFLEIEPHERPKRSLNPISKENATRYCAERLTETPVGKLCAKIGTNVQALVNICSSDIEVSFSKFIKIHQNQPNKLNFLGFHRMLLKLRAVTNPNMSLKQLAPFKSFCF